MTEIFEIAKGQQRGNKEIQNVKNRSREKDKPNTRRKRTARQTNKNTH